MRGLSLSLTLLPLYIASHVLRYPSEIGCSTPLVESIGSCEGYGEHAVDPEQGLGGWKERPPLERVGFRAA